MLSMRNIQPALQLKDLPAAQFLLFDAFRSNTETRPHSHPWGQLQIVSGGLLELQAQGKRFLSPPNLAIWVPPGIMHQSYNRKPIDYCSVNIVPELAEHLPDHVCLLAVTAIIEALISDLRARDIRTAHSLADKRLFKVLLDQLAITEQIEHFLPVSNHKLLAPVLKALELNPADETPLHVWAKRVHSTERTLARHCQNELGMNFTEWRLRMRYIYSLELLRSGRSVKDTAFTLGYNQASPFITMFKRYAECTPEQYKLKHAI
ncbi:AraC family transcriptional regulator [Psychromonas aquimarina]|uniref:AraC family transcriptional regulator n=1 Tax=Psychromonas aquimarina TaxID=444919 RepID=UPI0004081C31|nr:helix-turn-helix transcriptional regulator [Psychromonas aquimarina]